jgi:tRNA nucleotidyltransferase (CCA-adding enzyme)
MIEVYAVGGAIRDDLLDLPVHDRDYVVVGATPQDMLDQGYELVGKDFPVFLHPVTNDEYALARVERKIGLGYTGFAVDFSKTVTLEDDLARRDLTINAMARKVNTDGSLGPLIDPFGGEEDLQGCVFRHVGPAFKEDPVRILRLARFAARYPDFAIARETVTLMKGMVRDGEVDALVPERVWAEVSRGLMEKQPSRMVEVLDGCGALDRIAPGTAINGDLLNVLDRAAARDLPLPIRYAWWNPKIERGVPAECQQLAALFDKMWTSFMQARHFDSDRILWVLEQTDAFRKKERFKDLQTLFGLMRGEKSPEMKLFSEALDAVSSINNKEVIGQLTDTVEIKQAIREARRQAIATRLDIQ